jgi:hypothetical protein
MRSNPLRLLLLLFATFALMGGAAHAGTVRALNLDQMTDRADLIFTGRVVGKRAEWNTERTRIYTYVTFEVDSYLKGGNDSRLATVRLLGGQVGRYIAHLPGTPQFVVGEEVLLFCAGEHARIPSVLGLSLGKFTITTNTAGERILKRDISTLMLASYSTQSRRPGDPVRRYRLSEVTARIAEYQR